MFVSFPSINQFRDVLKSARMLGVQSLTFRGTVKLHGTNAGIVRLRDGTFECQSRSRTITPDDDNYGFAAFVQELPPEVLAGMFARFPADHEVVIFGEWAGQGINQGAAVCLMKRFFCPFAVFDITTDAWLDCNVEGMPYTVEHVPVEITVDVNDGVSVAEAQTRLAEITAEVERCCPFAYNNAGLEGVGEGVVWRAVNNPSTRFWFKVKGEAHSVSKVKTLPTGDIVKAQSVADFVEQTCTSQRLAQGVEALKADGRTIERANTGDFVRWVICDIVKEHTDLLEASGLTIRDCAKPISGRASKYFTQVVS